MQHVRVLVDAVGRHQVRGHDCPGIEHVSVALHGLHKRPWKHEVVVADYEQVGVGKPGP